jgi:alkaline phosphatase D
MSRKLFLLSLIVASFSGVANSQTSVTAPECIIPFYHGVASGDPLSDRVIIWTRITPDNFTLPVVVNYKMATDTAMLDVVSQGSVMTNADRDYTVKVDVTGLSPNTYYYYEFQANGARSQRGRTKTAPVGAVDSLRFAVVSCANLEAGYFNAYRVINERNDVDAVLMLGDYIYEYETDGYSPNPNVDREFEPSNEILTLDDYRMRYSIYHMDEALRKLHQNFPWICVWDDHESANDSYKDGAENHNAGEGDWETRKLAAQQAYFEWLPIREKAPENYEIFRTFKYGDLVDLIMVDTRLHGRVEQVGATSGELNNSSRTMLGEDQTNWLKDELSNSTSQWKVLGNQVMMAPITVFGIPINTDSWDGYPVTRQDLYSHILTNDIDNFVVITGDIHTSWALDLKSGSNKVGVEFVTPSVTSPGSPIDGGSVLMLENSHLKYVELTKKGFVILDVNTQRIQADWFYVSTIDQISSGYNWAKSYYSNSGVNQLVSTNTATSPSAKYDVIQAPECPRDITAGLNDKENEPKIIAVYPNPAHDELMFHFFSPETGSNLKAEIMDLTGRVLQSMEFETAYPAHKVNIQDLSPATYLLRITNDKGGNSVITFIKE